MRLTAAIALLLSLPSHAQQLQCAENAATNQMFCFAPEQLVEKDGIRTAPFYTGGPNRIDRTGFTVSANCATGVLHLKDARGVSFAGGGPLDSPMHTRDLRRYVCSADLPKPKKR